MTATDHHPAGPTGPADMAALATGRSRLYGLLAAVFRDPPTAEFLQSVLSPACLDDLAGFGVDVDALSQAAPDAPGLAELTVEFTRLFAGPGWHVSPYQSVHCGAGGALWGRETVAVKRFIEQAGFAYAADFHGLPDHIAAELELMARLSDVEADAWRRGAADAAANCRAIQRIFLRDHLGRWVGRFADAVVDQAALGFYAEMATLARDVVNADRRDLDAAEA